MSETPDDSRAHGIEMGSLAEDLEEETYPVTQGEILDRYGDRELDLASETTRLDEVLGDDTDREYEDAESVRQSVFNMVGEDAVGREEYSDRGGSTPEEDEDRGDESI